MKIHWQEAKLMAGTVKLDGKVTVRVVPAGSVTVVPDQMAMDELAPTVLLGMSTRGAVKRAQSGPGKRRKSASQFRMATRPIG
jgi:hypothetical protein